MGPGLGQCIATFPTLWAGELVWLKCGLAEKKA